MIPESDIETNSEDAPLHEFSGCHDEIVKNFQVLLTLTSLLKDNSSDPSIQTLSSDLLRFFKDVVIVHHEEEEEELFSAVLDSASVKSEAKLAREYTKRLIHEHRELEEMWYVIEDDIAKLSRGEAADINMHVANKLAFQYLEHAAFEEHFYLPLSARILSKTEKESLGLSLHQRH